MAKDLRTFIADCERQLDAIKIPGDMRERRWHEHRVAIGQAPVICNAPDLGSDRIVAVQNSLRRAGRT